MNRTAGDSQPDFTPRQGQYLAFIHAYTLVNGRPPAQADIQRFFQITPPSVHQMLLTLERSGLISRWAGVPRSIAVLVDWSALPRWSRSTFNRLKSLCRGTRAPIVVRCRRSVYNNPWTTYSICIGTANFIEICGNVVRNKRGRDEVPAVRPE